MSKLVRSPMDTQTVREWISLIQGKREALVRLLDYPNLGTLRVDINQALEEIDDLLDDFQRTFPEAKS
ncbi:hypothetical protein [Trichothermofontia sichuanensis]|uniref:hypothetical protein n=1 Tax=Trichothermofontia sichuanensis TaxID=3045816 RepID=UPI0036F26F08